MLLDWWACCESAWSEEECKQRGEKWCWIFL